MSKVTSYKIIPEHKELMEAPIKTEELLNTIKSLKNNKTLGKNSFHSEFYFENSDILVHLLTTFCNISYFLILLLIHCHSPEL